MTKHDDGMNRRKVLECMTWAGTGVLWTITGGVPASLGIIDEAVAAPAKGFTFLQISDSHMGFDKPANPDVNGHAGGSDRTDQGAAGEAGIHDPHRRYHASVEADGIRRRGSDHLQHAGLNVHYVPGEHDLLDEDQGKLSRTLRARTPRAPAGTASTTTACTSSAW